ncbi:MAG: hypothetical protein ACLR13_01895 [Acutalibacteraceae bacterium]
MNALEGGQAYLNVIMAFVGVAAGIVILIAAFNFATGKNVFPFHSCGCNYTAAVVLY